MATVDMAADHTLLDVAKAHNNKQLLDCATLLHKKNGFVRVATWEEANQLTTHVYEKEVKLADGVWRSVNEGIVSENPQEEQDTEPLSRIDSRSEIDEYIIDDIVPNPKEYRYGKDMRQSEGLLQSIATAFLYGNPALDINKPTGLQVRFNATSLDNVHSAGGSDALEVTSIYIVQFGKHKCNLLYGRDKGDKILNMEDMGKELITTNTSTGARLYKYVTKFNMMAGMVIPDDRAVQRICNIGTDGADEVDPDMIRWALDSLPDPDDISQTYIFANRLGRYQIGKALRNRPNMITSDVNQYGQQIERLMGAQIVMLEAISNTEAVVS